MKTVIYSVRAQIIACFSIFVIYLAIKHYSPNKKRLQPKQSVNRKEFFDSVKDGDLIVTRACNNWMSRIHSFFLKTPVAHVGIAVKGENNIFLFEASAPRGSQLRDIDQYMNEGAESLWWRPLKIPDKKRQDILLEIEKYSNHPYSWDFLKHLPKEIFGVDAPCVIENEDFSSSCGDLIAKIYTNVGLIQHSHRSWFPMNFIEYQNDMFDLPINVIFEKNK